MKNMPTDMHSKTHLQVPWTKYSEIYQFWPDASGKMGASIFYTHALIPEKKNNTAVGTKKKWSRILSDHSLPKID